MHYRIMMALVMAGMCYSSPVWAKQAKAVIAGTAPDSKITGEVILTDKDDGLEVEATVDNLSPGKHGFHIHEHGSCDEQGKAAGGHFNPDHAQHGYVPKDGLTKAHPGDMGNLEAGPDGKATVKVFLKGASLAEGHYGVMGKAVIVHENEDDFSQPTGNAGGRIGCGIIQ